MGKCRQAKVSNPLELSLSQSFEKERFLRAIEESANVLELRQIAKVLLDGWFTQRAASQWIMKEALAAQQSSTFSNNNGTKVNQ